MISPQRHINARAETIAQAERALATLGRWTAIAAVTVLAFLFWHFFFALTLDLPDVLRTAEAVRAG